MTTTWIIIALLYTTSIVLSITTKGRHAHISNYLSLIGGLLAVRECIEEIDGDYWFSYVSLVIFIFSVVVEFYVLIKTHLVKR